VGYCFVVFIEDITKIGFGAKMINSIPYQLLVAWSFVLCNVLFAALFVCWMLFVCCLPFRLLFTLLFVACFTVCLLDVVCLSVCCLLCRLLLTLLLVYWMEELE
jgi:hypothetical protein